jgi:hypothetical protein
MVFNQQQNAKTSLEQIAKTEKALFDLYLKYENTELSFGQYKDRLSKMFDFEVQSGRVPLMMLDMMPLPIDDVCYNSAVIDVQTQYYEAVGSWSGNMNYRRFITDLLANQSECCSESNSKCNACKQQLTPEYYCSLYPAECAFGCCKAMTPECLACAAGLSVDEYCRLHPGEWGCPGDDEQVVCCEALTCECFAC